MIRGGDNPKLRGRLAITALLFVLLTSAIGLIPSAYAGWSTTNPGINIWIDPNNTDNATTIYYMGTSYTVSQAVYGYDQTAYFYLHVKSDNYPNNTNLKWTINGVIEGPASSGDWYTNHWLGWALWNNSTSSWVGSGWNGVTISDVDNGENFTARLAINFGDETVINAYTYFPARVRLQLKLYNSDNSETYWTPNCDWWVWNYPLGTTTISDNADTYVMGEAPNNNYGNATEVVIGYGGANYHNYGFIKFPVAIPTNYGVQSATLKYYVSSSDSGINSTSLYRTNTGWAENELTKNNYTTLAYDIGSSLGAWTYANGWNTKDVTQSVISALANGAQYISFRLDANMTYSTTYIHILSKEYGDGSYAPQLIITYAPMITGTAPTFTMLEPQLAAKSGNYWSLNLQGLVTDMGSETGINFTFYAQNSPTGGSWHSFPTSPIYVSSASAFSTTTGYYFEDSASHRSNPTYYYLKLNGIGINLHKSWWYPENDWYRFYIDNGYIPPPPPPSGFFQATVTTTSVVPTDTTATAYYTFTVINGSGTAGIYYDLRTNADNLTDNNYTRVNTGASLSSTASLSYNIARLTASTDYWVRTVGIDASGSVYWDGYWYKFTTLASGGNVTGGGVVTWKHTISTALGLGSDLAGGILLTAILFLMLGLPVLYLAQGSDNLFAIFMVMAVLILAVATFAFMWVDPWILVSVIIFAIFGIAFKFGMRY